MKALLNICWAESLKFRRSRAPLMTLLAFAMLTPATALVLLAGNDPSRTKLFSQMTLQDQLAFIKLDWPAYFAALAGAAATGGLIIFSLLLIWIFAREHADRTSKELLTLPVPRIMLPLGKILVVAAWSLVLIAAMVLPAVAMGFWLGLDAWSPQALQSGITAILAVSAMAFCLALPFGFLACLSRGTMGAVAALFLTVVIALAATSIGWGAWFPWAVPAIFSAGGGTSQSPTILGTASFTLVALTGLAGLVGNMAWWRWADQR